MYLTFNNFILNSSCVISVFNMTEVSISNVMVSGIGGVIVMVLVLVVVVPVLVLAEAAAAEQYREILDMLIIEEGYECFYLSCKKAIAVVVFTY